jgi:hypothetical protein
VLLIVAEPSSKSKNKNTEVGSSPANKKSWILTNHPSSRIPYAPQPA